MSYLDGLVAQVPLHDIEGKVVYVFHSRPISADPVMSESSRLSHEFS